MRLDSVRSLKAEISAEVVASAETPEMATLFASSPPPMPAGVALGVAAGDHPGDFKLAIRTEMPELAAKYAERAGGEVDVKIVRVSAIPPVWTPPDADSFADDPLHSPGWLQKRQRPLQAGLQINIAGANFVGTLGGVVKDRDGVLYALTNSHVAADMGRTPLGTLIGQPFGSPGNYIGSLAKFIPFSLSTPNKVDCALVRLAATEVAGTTNGAIGGNVRGARHTSADDLHIEAFKIGRTTGRRGGRLVATDIDGLSVNMGDLGIVRFDDQLEFSGGDVTDFSAAGDSGSWILDGAGLFISLLFAGGTSNGVDVTFGNRADNVLDALGVETVAA